MGGWAVLTRVSGWVVGCIGLAACNLIVGSDVELNVPDAPVIVDPQPDAPMTVADAPATEAPDAIVITACGTTQPLAPCRATSIAVVGDWDGDRKATPGLYDEGRWCITNTRGPGPVCQFFQWGAAGFDPVVGDWGLNGFDSPAWYHRLSSGVEWSLRDALGPGNAATFGWGNPDMYRVPIGGKWSVGARSTPGNVKVDTSPMVWNLSTVNRGGGIEHAFTFGTGAPVVGDWDGDGVQTAATFNKGVWTFTNQIVDAGGTPAVVRTITFGADGDTPLAGDWDGDGIETIGYYRNGSWTLTDEPISTMGPDGPKTVTTFRWGLD